MTPLLTNRFDAEEWDRIHGELPTEAKSHVFRRSGEVALAQSRRLYTPAQKWLDVGCGTGRLAGRLAADGLTAVGVDHDPEMILYARRRAAAPGRTLPYIVASAERLPFPDASFDGLLAVSLLGCLDSPRDFFAEALRVLKPEGVAVMTFTNRASWLLRLNYALPGDRNSSGSKGPPRDVVRLHHAGDVRTSLEAVGYIVERLRYYNFVLDCRRRLFPPRRIAEALDRLDRTGAGRLLARNFVVVARKRTG